MLDRVNKYVKDFGLPCHLVINVVYCDDDAEIATKLVKMPKLRNSHFGIVLKSTSDSKEDDSKENDSSVKVSDMTEKFETAYNDKHKNVNDCKQYYKMYSMTDDCQTFFKQLVTQCDGTS